MAYPRHIQRAAELLGELPGIGPRQALRLAFALMQKNEHYRRELNGLLTAVQADLMQCGLCFRITETHETQNCAICRSPNRNRNTILIVEKEQDVEQFERAGAFDGLYHITGGVVSPLEKNPGEKLHVRELFDRIKNHRARASLEIIIATSNTLEGNQTGNYIERILDPLTIKITRLGRGLSTGAEIEYADPLTLEAAFKNRR